MQEDCSSMVQHRRRADLTPLRAIPDPHGRPPDRRWPLEAYLTGLLLL